MPGVGEQAREPLAQQHLVLDDHDPHGSSAVRRGAGRALDVQRAAVCGDPVAEPADARAVGRAADAVVAHAHDEPPVAPVGADRDRRGPRMLDRVGQRFTGDEVRGRLQPGAEALTGRADLDRQRRAAGELAQRRLQPRVELRRRQPLGQLAQLVDRPLVSSVDRAVEVGARLVLDVAQLESDRDQPLLCAVVQVALDPPALRIARGDDPRARGLDLGELAAQLHVQAGDLDREPARIHQHAQQIGPLRPGRAVHDHRHGRPARWISVRSRPSSSATGRPEPST